MLEVLAVCKQLGSSVKIANYNKADKRYFSTENTTNVTFSVHRSAADHPHNS